MKYYLVPIYCTLMLVGSAVLFCVSSVELTKRIVDLVYWEQASSVSPKFTSFETYRAREIFMCADIKDDSLRARYQRALDDQTLQRRYEGEKAYQGKYTRYVAVRRFSSALILIVISAVLFISHLVILRSPTPTSTAPGNAREPDPVQ